MKLYVLYPLVAIPFLFIINSIISSVHGTLELNGAWETRVYIPDVGVDDGFAFAPGDTLMVLIPLLNSAWQRGEALSITASSHLQPHEDAFPLTVPSKYGTLIQASLYVPDKPGAYRELVMVRARGVSRFFTSTPEHLIGATLEYTVVENTPRVTGPVCLGEPHFCDL